MQFPELALGLLQFLLDAIDRADDEDTITDTVGEPQRLEEQPQRETERDVLEVDRDRRFRSLAGFLKALRIDIDRQSLAVRTLDVGPDVLEDFGKGRRRGEAQGQRLVEHTLDRLVPR